MNRKEQLAFLQRIAELEAQVHALEAKVKALEAQQGRVIEPTPHAKWRVPERWLERRKPADASLVFGANLRLGTVVRSERRRERGES